MTDNRETTPEPESESLQPGVILRRAREAAGMSLREVADSLHLLPRQITALEADDYHQFNGEVFCKGYLRAYGKLLNIDADVLVDHYVKLLPQIQAKPLVAKPIARPVQQPGKGHTIQYWSFAAFIAVVAVLWVQNADVNSDSDVIPGAVETQAVVIDENDRSLVQNLEPAALKPVIDPARASVADMAEQPVERSVVDTAVQTARDTTVAAVSTEAPVDIETSIEQKASDLLSFYFADDCWVEVKDSGDNVIFAALKRAQDTLKLSGSAPFRVLLGYAPGVSLDYNGEPVTINVNRKNQSALLVVGQL